MMYIDELTKQTGCRIDRHKGVSNLQLTTTDEMPAYLSNSLEKYTQSMQYLCATK